MALKKQNRLRFTVNSDVQNDIEAIESYYQEPVSKLMLEKAIGMIQEKAKTLPDEYRPKVHAHH